MYIHIYVLSQQQFWNFIQMSFSEVKNKQTKNHNLAQSTLAQSGISCLPLFVFVEETSACKKQQQMKNMFQKYAWSQK